jgi:acyl-CoA reductase-like NAD-dependent aldehyde dehydrogenase
MSFAPDTAAMENTMDDFRLLIGGELTRGDCTIDVINPATETVIAKGPHASAAQLDAAVAAAKAAFPGWSARPIAERQGALSAIAERIVENTGQLARLLTLEQGKPLADAVREVQGTAGYFRYYASLNINVELLEDSTNRRVEAYRKPLGVIGAIVPWNFPLVLMGFKVPAALLAGNTVVLKPAATTPLATLKFAELICDLLPPGVLNVIADSNDLGAHLAAHPDIRKISFTGSTATGAKVMAGAAPTLKRVTLELGGNDAAIVLDDADPKRIAPQLFHHAFRNSGQVCIAVKRLYVHDSIYDEMCGELATLAEAAIVGNGLQQGTQFGPLQNKAQYERLVDLISDARTHGRVIAGGVSEGPGYFIRPTIVRDVTEGIRLVDEEQFGPALPVIKYSDPDDAVARANNSPYGLGGSIWSSNIARAHDLATELDVGTVWINKHAELSPEIPFGGAKQSGIGLELGAAGLAEFTQLRIVNAAR